MSAHYVERYHDISCGHRVFGHEGKCQHLHGHNYRVHFTCMTMDSDRALDSVGRVIDFGVVKSELCMWLEDNWDHHFLMWEGDPALATLQAVDSTVVPVPFNPTAENMAEYLVNVIGPQQMAKHGIILTAVRIEETAKCSAMYVR